MKQTKLDDFLLLEEEKEKLEFQNIELERRVKEEVKKSREKDELLFQQSKLASMGEMIANISHQWRQPLMEISSLFIPLEASIKLNKQISKDDLVQRIETLHEITSYMSNTIDDFKNFFASDKKKEEFRISQQINTSVNIIGASLKRHKINLDIIIKSNPLIYGYKNEYSQVLINILTNASDLLVQREIINPKIVIKIEEKNNQLLLSVQDNAQGVKCRPLNKVFEPYYTKGKKNGSGLGLFMSHLIVSNNLKGELKVRNYEDGAIFLISIPIKNKKN